MRLLFLTPRPLWPGRRGDQVRTSGLLAGLAPKHEVHLLSQRWPNEAVASPTTDLASAHSVEISRWSQARAIGRASFFGATGLGEKSLQSMLFEHDAFEAAALEAIERVRPEIIVVVLSRLGSVVQALARGGGPRIPIVLDLIDALGANMRRRADRDAWLSPLWRREARRLDAWDARLIRQATLSTVVAERDRQALLEAEASIDPASLRVLPFGLEVEAMSRGEAEEGAGELLVLTGNLGYFPTVEGARWFGERVWPRLKTLRPSARWILAGSRPAPAIRELASARDVELVENPPDLGSILARADLSIAPLRAGSGTPIKILEAMASRVPVLTTPAGREGLDALPEGAVAVASEPEAFADQAAELLADPALRRRQAERAFTWVQARHDLPRVVEQFEALLEEARDF